jgi:hypothetical protein
LYLTILLCLCLSFTFHPYQIKTIFFFLIRAEDLDYVLYRVGMLAVLRSKSKGGKLHDRKPDVQQSHIHRAHMLRNYNIFLDQVWWVGSRLATVCFTIHFYNLCWVGLSTPDSWCNTVATQVSFLHVVRL